MLSNCFGLGSSNSDNARRKETNGGYCKYGEVFHDGERVTEKAENVNIFFVLFFFFIFAKVYFFLDKSLTENAFLTC